MDLLFWLVLIIALTALLTTCLGFAKAFVASIDLEMAERDMREAHATIDCLAREADNRPARGAKGRFVKRAA